MQCSVQSADPWCSRGGGQKSTQCESGRPMGMFLLLEAPPVSASSFSAAWPRDVSLDLESAQPEAVYALGM